MARLAEHCCAQLDSTVEGSEDGGVAHPAENIASINASGFKVIRTRFSSFSIFFNE
jgi:hypothetical protein